MARAYLKVIGGVLVLIGLVGFVLPFPGLLDLTPVHNLVHLITGAAAILLSTSESVSIKVAWVYGAVYTLVGLVGLITRDVLGIITLTPADNLIHFALGIGSIAVAVLAAQRTGPAVRP